MNSAPLSHLIAAGLIAVYGLISIGAGTLGYVNKGSVPSIVAGGISGLLLLLCAVGVFYKPTWSLIGAGVIAVALIGRFATKALHPSEDPEDAVINTVARLMAFGGIVVLLSAIVAVLQRGTGTGDV
jgi:uncharacterized membrane protein (UPF0136 family)